MAYVYPSSAGIEKMPFCWASSGEKHYLGEALRHGGWPIRAMFRRGEISYERL
ncbi:hypothetical protein [Nonomuraea sediminis]|uniref:hypothetical protein n=1 Tax=Nonomuraea sediminis TaxID=2835864 RepID=UPI001BDCDD47|nr:hypothetical protein [Nonomuraea sediminis]